MSGIEINQEDSSRKLVLEGVAALYHGGQQIMSTINIQNDSSRTNKRAQEFLQSWKEGKVTMINVLTEHGKLVEEYKLKVQTYIKDGRGYVEDLEKVKSKFGELDQLLATKEEVSWNKVKAILDLPSVRHVNITEQYQKICDLTESIQAQNLAMSHILLDEGVYNRKNKNLSNEPEVMAKSITAIQQNKVKVNPNFGESSPPRLAGTGLSTDQVQKHYPDDFLKYQSDFEGTQLLFKAKENHDKLQAHYDKLGESGDVSLLSEQRLRNEISGTIGKLDDMKIVQLLDTELGGVHGEAAKERVLMKLELLLKPGQQIAKGDDIPSSIANPQKYVEELKKVNQLFKNFKADIAKTDWDKTEKSLTSSLGVMSMFLSDKPAVVGEQDNDYKSQIKAELDSFSKIANGRLEHKINKAASKRPKVDGEKRLSVKDAIIELIKNVVSTIVDALSSILPEQQILKGAVGLGRRNSYNFSQQHDSSFKGSDDPPVKLIRSKSTSDLGTGQNEYEEQGNSHRPFSHAVGGSHDIKALRRSKSARDLRLSIQPSAGMPDKKEEGVAGAVTSSNTENLTSVLKNPQVERTAALRNRGS